MDLSSITINSNGSVKGKASFVRRLAIGFVILAILGLLYVPAYHSAQSPFSSLSETPSSAEPLGNSRLIASVGTHLLLDTFSHNNIILINFKHIVIHIVKRLLNSMTKKYFKFKN